LFSTATRFEKLQFQVSTLTILKKEGCFENKKTMVFDVSAITLQFKTLDFKYKTDEPLICSSDN